MSGTLSPSQTPVLAPVVTADDGEHAQGSALPVPAGADRLHLLSSDAGPAKSGLSFADVGGLRAVKRRIDLSFLALDAADHALGLDAEDAAC